MIVASDGIRTSGFQARDARTYMDWAGLPAGSFRDKGLYGIMASTGADGM